MCNVQNFKQFKSLDLQKVCPYLNSMSAAADPVQLVADEPLTDGAHPLCDGPPAAHLQLLRRRVELRAHRVSDQCLLHDLPGCVCKLLSTSANCKYFYKKYNIFLPVSGIQSIVTLSVLALQRYMMVTRLVDSQ